VYAEAPAELVFQNLKIVIAVAEMLGLSAAIREYWHRGGLVTRIHQPTFSLIIEG